ncbi:excisionase family DNA binding protein [Aquimarina sp. MAR_2010_214]|uniref:helix-turn-helix domain-containing protein n=1 Tax=Aquimarina sp. MAR_2010_214 TaxID=1250026 RepID=UPI000C70366B|nr:helix-turn-helix domain-containing protein [Aquimarina sp. MAR_2010_214]PKV49228.1 excisionase family DNA binding protein [Aquimarina sp. MAR_2010_214]
MSFQLITHSKKDLERIVEVVIDRLRKTEFIQQTPINPTEDRLSQKEAAKFLGISVTSLIAWKKKGKVPYFQIGRSVFFSKSQLLKLAQKNPGLVQSSRR